MRKLIAILLPLAMILASCKPDNPAAPPLHRVTIMYAAAYSSLSASITSDINDMCEGMLPSLSSGDVFVVYAHTRASSTNHNINPVLFRAWRDKDGTAHRDTLKTYPKTDVSSSPEVMNKVLNDIKDLYPAPHYGLMISSHGMGWLPRAYEEAKDAYVPFSVGTREICIENVNGSGIDVNLLPDALPMKMDFILMDSCLMGCVEVAHELRDKCGLLLFSATEILSDGMVYTTMPPLLLNVANPDLKTIARQYYEHYQAQRGLYQSASITLVDCAQTEQLAQVCKKLTNKYRTEISFLNHNDVQAYFYNESTHYFFDLRDIYVQAGITAEELAELDAALEKTVQYTASTDKFFNLELERVCGLSMYLPYWDHDKLNAFYQTLSWNQAIGLIP